MVFNLWIGAGFILDPRSQFLIFQSVPSARFDLRCIPQQFTISMGRTDW